MIMDTLVESIPTLAELASADLSRFASGKKSIFKGISPETLAKFQRRAQLVKSNGKPYLTSAVVFPHSDVELFFDIETDPMHEFCYLHGFVERTNGDATTERYHAFFADEMDDTLEKQAFASALQLVRERPGATIYYYSKYERTWWRNLQEKYPDVCPAEEIEAIFDPGRAIDLYFDVVKKSTEWPTPDHSIKTLARYLGFDWRDEHPSGAASIEWFDRWIKEKNPSMKERILQYNEDDCKATGVLLDGIRGLG